MNHETPLETVQKDFLHWRKICKKRTSIPDELWQQVFPLLNDYPISKICAALSLNTDQIRSRLRTPNNIEKTESNNNFAEVKLKPEYANDIKGLSIEITRRDGATLLINTFPSSALNLLIDHF